MPVAYLDVPTGADRTAKGELVAALYRALHEVWPFPDDTRIFLREWSPDDVSQNGMLRSDPMRPVLVLHVPEGGNADAKRTMLTKVNAAVVETYRLPELAIFLHEHPLDRVAVNGELLAEDHQRVEDQAKVYG